MGGARDEAVQRVGGGVRMVPRTYGRRHVVAYAGASIAFNWLVAAYSHFVSWEATTYVFLFIGCIRSP